MIERISRLLAQLLKDIDISTSSALTPLGHGNDEADQLASGGNTRIISSFLVAPIQQESYTMGQLTSAVPSSRNLNMGRSSALSKFGSVDRIPAGGYE